MSFSTPASLKLRMSTVKAAQLSAESGDVPDDTAIQTALTVGYQLIRTELAGVIAASTVITDADDIAMLVPVEEALALAELYGVRRDVQIRTTKTEIDLNREWALKVLTRLRTGDGISLNSAATGTGGDIRYGETATVYNGAADL